MAIDTASKRASALGFGFVALTLVVPDGAIDQGDRQTVAHSYNGILATAAVAAADKTFGIRSIIQEHGRGVLSTISSDGNGSLSTITNSLGMTSIIQEAGKGVSSAITSSGQSADSEI